MRGGLWPKAAGRPASECDVPRGTSSEQPIPGDDPARGAWNVETALEAESRGKSPIELLGRSRPREQSASRAKEVRLAKPGARASDRADCRDIEGLPADFLGATFDDAHVGQRQIANHVTEERRALRSRL